MGRTPVKKEKQMTVEQSTDASFHPSFRWKSLDWTTIEEQVRRLQTRIAKAVQQGKHRRAQALQWLLTHSRAAKLWAVRKVTTNRGAKTPGVDNKVQEAANPYDPRYTDYFAKRGCSAWRVRADGSPAPVAGSPAPQASTVIRPIGETAAACPHLGAPVSEA